MELNPATPLLAIDVEVLLRLSVAALGGMLLGLDPELRGHAAGLRTHGIICFAAAAMTVSILALHRQLGREHMDPLRVFEATGAFIGIIGAGLIVFSKGQVRNLTTAAHLWLAAVAGVACGAGQWPLVMLTLVAFVEKRMGTYNDDAEDSAEEAPAAKKGKSSGPR